MTGQRIHRGLYESEANLLDVSIVRSVDELLQFSQAIGFGQGKDQLCLHIGLAGLLTSHLKEFDQVLPVSWNTTFSYLNMFKLVIFFFW